jgi:hypothetical protein
MVTTFTAAIDGAKASTAITGTSTQCDKNVIPIKKIKGFTLISKECGSSGSMPKSTLIFESKLTVEGLDLMEIFDGNSKNAGTRTAARMIQSMNRSLHKKWRWDENDLGPKKTFTPRILATKYRDCGNTMPDSCVFYASYIDSKASKYFTLTAAPKWMSTTCSGRGWYLCKHKMQLTVFTTEAYID